MIVNSAVQQEVELTEKSLTLKEISPKWYERIFGNEKRLPFPLSPVWIKWYFELDSPSRCVIGEAHGYSSSYEQTCKECDRLGWNFGKSFFLRSRSRLEDNVNEFVHHWNTKHLSWFLMHRNMRNLRNLEFTTFSLLSWISPYFGEMNPTTPLEFFRNP